MTEPPSHELLQPKPVEALDGNERFVGAEANVRGFWSWAFSDLRANVTRGVLAEFLIAKAVGAQQSVREAWDNYDVLAPDGTRIEVKSSAYLQSWAQREHSRISFDRLTGLEWDAKTNEWGDHRTVRADVFVFAVHTERDPDAYDALDVGKWEFYVVGAGAIREAQTRTIGIGWVRTHGRGPLEFHDLAEAIRRARPAAVGDDTAFPGQETPPEERLFDIEGPIRELGEVRAWADSALPFDNLTPAQREFRAELRERLTRLSAGPEDVLHALYSGSKHPQADVENILLYNVDQGGGAFRGSAKGGVRFELADRARTEAPSGRRWASTYRYRLAPRDGAFSEWQAIRELAAFEAVDLGPFSSEHRLAQVWWALRRAAAALASERLGWNRAFAVRLRVRAPAGTFARPELVKSLVDGTVAAFQAYRDRRTVEEVAARVAGTLDASSQEVAHELLDDRRAALGSTDRLLYLRGRGVQWNLADDRCLAGEVLIEESASQWSLEGVVEEIESR